MGSPRGWPSRLPCLAQFVIVLDVTIVAVALPALQADLGLSTTALGWVITAYTLVFGGCLLAAGRLADRIGRRRTFALGLAVFAAASLACGLAPTAAVLLAARAVQGIGAALVSPAALALVTSARPEGRERARALGWWTAAAAGGGASGWVLGGVLSGLLDWRWVFLVNVPICFAGAAPGPARARRVARSAHAPPLDAAGALLATTGPGVARPGPHADRARRPARDPDARGVRGRRRAAGRVRPRRDPDRAPTARPQPSAAAPGVLGPNAVAAVLTATTSPAIFLCILHAQQILDIAAGDDGRAAVRARQPRGDRGLAARPAPRLPRRPAAVMAAGLLAVAAGALALCAIADDAPALTSLPVGFVVLGLGLGVASVASTTRGTDALGAADQGLASALLATSAQLGTAFGLAIFLPIAAARTEALGNSPAAHVAGYRARLRAGRRAGDRHGRARDHRPLTFAHRRPLV